MKNKHLLLLCGLFLAVAACKKGGEAGKAGEGAGAPAEASPFAGTWVNAAEPRYIVVQPDGNWYECFGRGADLAGSGGIRVKGNTVINPDDGVVIYSNVSRSGSQLVIDGVTYYQGEISQECKDFMAE